ncbi:alpha/beta hydrolase [Geodermatophilus sp. SYSU D00815]
MTGPAPRPAAEGRLESRPTTGAPRGCPEPGLHPLDLGPGVEVVLAVPPGEPAPRPLLVFFHGAGGTAAQGIAALGGVAEERGVLVLAPTSAATTWDLLAGGWGRDVAVLDAALDAAAQTCAISRVGFAGFSDGASYALSLGLGNGDLAEAVVAFSPGFVAPPAVHGRPRVWISHGTGDRVLPVDVCGRRVVRVLRREGYTVTYEEFDGGHVVPPALARQALAWWLDAGT